MMKIGVYCNDYRPEDGGASSLLNTIMNEIHKDEDSSFEFVFLYEGSLFDPYKVKKGDHLYINVNHKKILTLKTLSRISRILGIELSFRLDKIVNKEDIQYIWFPSPFYTGISSPFIFTVWDLGHKTTSYPEVSKWYVVRARDFMYSRMLERATYVITANETGKREIVEYYGTDEKKVVKIPFPVSDFCLGNSIKPVFDIPEIFFFYPAQFWFHKNHIVIIKAAEILKKEYNLEPVIFFTGSDHGSMKYVKEQISQSGLEEQIRLTGFLKSEELKYLYMHATAMIYASMLGPNNLPPEEAFVLGCPVIITNIEGHLEEARNTWIFFNGNDERELADIMQKMINKAEKNKEYFRHSPIRYDQSKKYIEKVKPLFIGRGVSNEQF